MVIDLLVLLLIVLLMSLFTWYNICLSCVALWCLVILVYLFVVGYLC